MDAGKLPEKEMAPEVGLEPTTLRLTAGMHQVLWSARNRDGYVACDTLIPKACWLEHIFGIRQKDICAASIPSTSSLCKTPNN